MKIALLLTFLSLVSTKSMAMEGCLKESIEQFFPSPSEGTHGQIIQTSIGRHTLAFHQDSCGIRGCHYLIFTQIAPRCQIVSFHQVGFLLLFQGHRIEIRSKGIKFTYIFSNTKHKFRVAK